VQDGVELIPTFNWPRERLLILLAGGEKAMAQAVEGAEDEVARAAELTRHHGINSGDVLVAVAASGTTPFTLACLRAGRQTGALTIGIANNSGTPILIEADHPILLETGPEPIAGSTRMNAGTAQRITLSVLSSLVMIRLGRVYRGMMVDMRATNTKLVNRQVKMLMRITGRSEEESREALRRSNRDVKVAILLLEGCAVEDAKTILEASGGRLQTAIDFFAKHGSARAVAS
jgi:N-acetylmuramic acid 6-phosphate etherase